MGLLPAGRSCSADSPKTGKLIQQKRDPHPFCQTRFSQKTAYGRRIRKNRARSAGELVRSNGLLAFDRTFQVAGGARFVADSRTNSGEVPAGQSRVRLPSAKASESEGWVSGMIWTEAEATLSARFGSLVAVATVAS